MKSESSVNKSKKKGFNILWAIIPSVIGFILIIILVILLVVFLVILPNQKKNKTPGIVKHAFVKLPDFYLP